MRKIKKGDDVIVIAGKDKGKRGSVMRVVGDDGLVVQGVNRVKKHQKPNPAKGLDGGITELEMPLHLSNVAIFNFSTKKADRVGFKINDKNQKIRIFKSNGQEIDA
ncbi:large subunit ribosomal protein L24 [Nitrosomonas cryotolerans]|uniref:Large ribosomal subunit protein uL24 n=1 Tax=Nitrosomonas cryotolerans ATCC 49181 TaxID=1131553 RepID=A0A1N6HJW8_9PROT|nr:50S ribosomal protein L24 [Nitrosomonas cryotolerans]SFP64904.1 large subunit ribosomal protein L24 [Nitrosomonas cryotolerans]SIO20027.1 large subunit ribosomal protein L24 [Nitrosomonas cryotolerans ATCC 49181]